MAKYKVGDELIIVSDPNKEADKLKELTTLSVDGDFAQISWGIKILEVEYDEFLPEIINNVIQTNSREVTTISKYASSRIYG